MYFSGGMDIYPGVKIIKTSSSLAKIELKSMLQSSSSLKNLIPVILNKNPNNPDNIYAHEINIPKSASSLTPKKFSSTIRKKEQKIGFSPDTPAEVLRRMFHDGVNKDNAKMPEDIAEGQRSNNLLKTLEDMGLLEGGREKPYYIPDRVLKAGVERIIDQNPELNLKKAEWEQIEKIRIWVDSIANIGNWRTELLNFEECKESFRKLSQGDKFINKWRLQASLASNLTKEELQDFTEWAKDFENGELSVKHCIETAKIYKHMQVFELWENLSPFIDKNVDKGIGEFISKEERELLIEVGRYGAMNYLVAHGTANDGLTDTHIIGRHWALLNIMIEGKLTAGMTRVIDVSCYGPYYVIFDESGEHVIYLVPNVEAILFLKKGLKEAESLGIITFKNAQKAFSKIMTYTQLVNTSSEQIADIMIGKKIPPQLITYNSLVEMKRKDKITSSPVGEVRDAGGIDLANIELLLEDEAYVKASSPVSLRVLLAINKNTPNIIIVEFRGFV